MFCQMVNCLFGLSRVVGSSGCCLVVLGQEVVRQVMFGQEVV